MTSYLQQHRRQTHPPSLSDPLPEAHERGGSTLESVGAAETFRDDPNRAPHDPCVPVSQLPVELTALAGRATHTVAELEGLSVGAIVRFAAPAAEMVLLANGQPIARGLLIEVDGSSAVQITALFGASADSFDATAPEIPHPDWPQPNR